MQIRELRKQKGKTQEEMANELGIKKQNLQNYEIGKREPKIEIMLKLSNYFGCTLDELIGNEKRTNNNVSPDKQQLKDRISGLTQIECIKVGAYIDALIVQRKEKRQNIINSIINDKGEI